MREVGYAQVRTWMEHLDEDCALEEQEEAVRGLIEYVQHDERREMSFLQRIFLGGDLHSFTRHNAACVVAALDDDIIEYYAPLCLDWLWDVNWPGAEIIFDRLTIVRGDYVDAMIERALRVCDRYDRAPHPEMWRDTLKDLQKRRAAYKSGHPLRGYSRCVDVGCREDADARP